MLSIKKITAALITALLIILSAASSQASDLKIAASSMPDAQIIDSIRGELASYGINLIITTVEPIGSKNYKDPNLLLATGEIDAHFCQSAVEIEAFASEHNADLISAGGIFLRPMNIYSAKYKSIYSVPDIGQAIIPANYEGRALAVLNASGLIKLKAGTGYNGNYDSIEKIEKGYKIMTLPEDNMIQQLNLFDLAVLSQEYAIKAKLNPVKNAVFSEPKDSPYAESVGIRKSDINKFEIKMLMKALRSDKTKKFIESRYGGLIIPSY